MDKLSTRSGHQWSHVLGVRPSGWCHSRRESAQDSLVKLRIVTRGDVSLLEVPYSEHSSLRELKRFVRFLGIKDHRDIIDTVFKNKIQSDLTRKMFKDWTK